jgi:hypothetical protein
MFSTMKIDIMREVFNIWRTLFISFAAFKENKKGPNMSEHLQENIF